MIVHSLPLLAVEVIDKSGVKHTNLSFNDAWIERSTGQVGWIQLKLNGKVKILRAIADGMLVATAAGSTAYAFALGCSPVPITSRSVVLVGSNVREPVGLRPITLPQNEFEIVMTAIDPEKRPMKAFCDCIELGECVQMRIYMSRTAVVQLAMLNSNSMTEKMLQMQFPASSH